MMFMCLYFLSFSGKHKHVSGTCTKATEGLKTRAYFAIADIKMSGRVSTCVLTNNNVPVI